MRVAISVIALYALLLQAYIAAAAPASSFDPSQDIRCAPGEVPQDRPGGTHSDSHCLCCVLACVACGYVYLASASGPVFPPRLGASIIFMPSDAAAGSVPSRFYFTARGPPTDL